MPHPNEHSAGGLQAGPVYTLQAAMAQGGAAQAGTGQGMTQGMVQHITQPAVPQAVTLEVVHETRYEYTSAVSLAHHLAHLQPLQDGQQRLLAFELNVSPAGAERRASRDIFGNTQHHISLAQPHAQLQVRALSQVQVAPRFTALQPEAAPPWDSLAQSLRYVARSPYQPALQYCLPSPFVPRLAELRAYALPHFPAGRPVAAAALALMHALHADFRYESLSTDIDTPLARAFAQRRGVCQDFAHLLAGMLRMLGLPARYVSGYLLTHPPAGAPVTPSGAGLLGADASHAWVQVWCPGTPGLPPLDPHDTPDGQDPTNPAPAACPGGWLDLDPTNDLVPGSGHVRVAVGRDFGDVTPLRGVIRGGGRHDLAVGVRTRVLPPPGPDVQNAIEPFPGVLVAREA